MAAFEAGFDPTECAPISAVGIRCLVSATNQDLIALHYSDLDASEYSTHATVTFSEGGISGFDFPALLASSIVRLAAFAGEDSGLPEACRKINYDAADLPALSATLAQTAPCGRALAEVMPGAVAAVGS